MASRAIFALLSSLALFGCALDGKAEVDTLYLDDAQATCDPNQSSFDDLFYFEAWTSGPATEVSVALKDGGDTLVEMDMDEEDDGYWYAEIWADDVPSDCDDFYGLRTEFTASSDDGQVVTAEAY